MDLERPVVPSVGFLLVRHHRRHCYQCRHRHLHHVHLDNQEEAVEVLCKNQKLGSLGGERLLKRAPEFCFKLLQLSFIGAVQNHNSS